MHPVFVLDAIEMAFAVTDLSKGEAASAHVRLVQPRKLAESNYMAELFTKVSSDYKSISLCRSVLYSDQQGQ
jgi:hypothetical protein